MKKLYILFLAALLVSLTEAQAQQQGKVHMLKKGPQGKPSFIRFSTTQEPLPASQKIETLRTYLKLEPDDKLKSIQMRKDALGFEHEKFQQYYKGLKVEYGSYNVHTKANIINSINGHIIPVKNLNTRPKISERQALKRALDYVDAQTYMWEGEVILKNNHGGQESYYPEGELVIVENFRAQIKEERKPVLAYKFNIYAKEPLSRAYIYVNAHSGEIVHENAIIKHATTSGTAESRYSGSRSIQTDSYNGSYRLRDYSRGNGIETYDLNWNTSYTAGVDFVDNDNDWTAAEWNNANKDNAALDAHWGAQMTYDYFLNTHNRNSWDGNGAKIKSYVHYDLNYENAFWNGSAMTFGDGDNDFDALTSLDVVAHEFGHGLCDKTANLVYQKESGALNEGFSDIWGACVEYYAAPEKNNWLIGEEITLRSAAMRSLSKPKFLGQPDTYKGEKWVNTDCIPSRSNDYCGVHTNSGVLNYWFYLLAEGQDGINDLGNSYSVSAIGIEEAARIAYRLESVYLTAYSNYADAREYGIQAAIDLFGEGSPQHVTTVNAWHAVGLGDPYDLEYCTSKGNRVINEWITEVSIGSFTNNSGAGSYTDFTGKEVHLNAGQTYAIKLTPGFKDNYNNDEFWRIWIDYNNDDDFSDPGELVFDPDSPSESSLSGNITIASSASGSTRMRVSMKAIYGPPTACESFPYGEVEDYTVTFDADEISCETPTDLSTSDITATSATLNWSAVSEAVNYELRYRATGTTNWITTSSTTTSKTVNGLSASTEYEFQLRTVCSEINSAYSSSATFTTPPASVSYCTSEGSNSNYEWIDLVSLNEINNSTGNNDGYGNFAHLTATVALGSSNTMTVSAGFSGTAYKEYWKIWIDLNQDGDFEDAGELMDEGGTTTAGNATATINIPTSASLGTTRMRVSMKYSTSQGSCENFAYGEVEDYSVNITSGSFGIVANKTVAEGEALKKDLRYGFIAPNPASSLVKIDLSGFREDVKVSLFDMQGREIKARFNAEGQQLDVSALKSGIYLIKVYSAGDVQVHRLMKD
jgi:bacillolysin